MSNGLVSVIMPTFKCGRFIAESIKSVQAQTYKDWELIIVDDCSNDETVATVLGFTKEDDRISFYQNSINSGAAVTRNTALRNAQGRWIAFLDSDDLWESSKLEKQINFMEENGYAFSYHEYVEIDEQDNLLGVKVSGKKRIGKFDMFACCWPGCLSVMYDAEKIGLIQINDIKKNNDTAMWLKVIRKADCYLLPECLGKYRRRANSITPKPLWKRVWAHYPLFRVAEEMNPIAATFWVIMNVFGNAYKKMRKFRNLLMLLGLMVLMSCERRALEEPEFSTEIEVRINLNTISNVTCDIYNDKIPVPVIDPEVMKVLFYDIHSHELVAESFISDISDKDGQKVIKGRLNILP